MEGGDDEGEASRGGGRGGHMDSDSSDSEVVGPPLPPGYEVMLLIDVFGTDVLVLQLLLSQTDHFQNHVPHLQCSVGL